MEDVRGVVTHRRKMAKGLCFWTLHNTETNTTIQVVLNTSKTPVGFDSQLWIDLVRPCCIVAVRGTIISGEMYPESCKIEKVNPHCDSILRIVEFLKTGRIGRCQVLKALHIEPSVLDSILECRDRKVRRRIIIDIERQLDGRSHIIRQRPPKISRSDLDILESYESSTSLYKVTELDVSGVKPLNLNIVNGLSDPSEKSRRGHSTREEYLVHKKIPQIEYLLLCLESIKFTRVLDIGGGRGDLGISIAHRFPKCKVYVLDKNSSSLEAGAKHGSALGVAVDFIEGDVNDVNISSLNIDLVVGLHSCGGLTDHIISKAIQMRVSFLVCPCCFTKFHEMAPSNKFLSAHSRERLGRLAESKDHSISLRSMLVLNSLRLSMASREHFLCHIYQFSPEYSLKNSVLCGVPDTAHHQSIIK